MYTHTYIRTELGRITGRVDVEELLDIIFRDFCSETRTCTQAYMYASTSSSATSAVSGRHYLYMNTHPSEGVALDSLQLANEHSCGHNGVGTMAPCSWVGMVRDTVSAMFHPTSNQAAPFGAVRWQLVGVLTCMYVCMYVCAVRWQLAGVPHRPGWITQAYNHMRIYIYIRSDGEED